jgi:hypothetical protein
MRTFFSRQALPGGKTKPSGWRLIKRRLILLVVLILALGVGLSAGLTALFRWVPPPASAIMLHRALSEGFHYEYQWTSLPEIAPEAWFTLLIETIWPKRRILEVYLNVAEMGNRVYGVQAASEHFFGIMPVDLSDKQAALLAAVLPNPRRFRVEAPSIYVRQRQHWILKQMRQLGGIDRRSKM